MDIGVSPVDCDRNCDCGCDSWPELACDVGLNNTLAVLYCLAWPLPLPLAQYGLD